MSGPKSRGSNSKGYLGCCLFVFVVVCVCVVVEVVVIEEDDGVKAAAVENDDGDRDERRLLNDKSADRSKLLRCRRL
jgi:hypothetical protein